MQSTLIHSVFSPTYCQIKYRACLKEKWSTYLCTYVCMCMYVCTWACIREGSGTTHDVDPIPTSRRRSKEKKIYSSSLYNRTRSRIYIAKKSTRKRHIYVAYTLHSTYIIKFGRFSKHSPSLSLSLSLSVSRPIGRAFCPAHPSPRPPRPLNR